jgi:ABC-type polysaccharide/polyol phosphate transport system ATPase subunit
MAEHLDTPLKYFSSGMEARLAFSVAVCVSPDLLLLDEVLAVGDHEFQQRCFNRLREYNKGGGTIVLVSHDFSRIREFCSRAVWLERGAVRMDGEAAKILEVFENAPANTRASGNSAPEHRAA